MPSPRFSFEYFPPKSPQDAIRLCETVRELDQFSPKFCSITYGANGSAQSPSLDAIKLIANCSDAPIYGHITGGSTPISETLLCARALRKNGAEGLVALRGDTEEPSGLDSVTFTRALRRDFSGPIFTSAYPDPHPDARSTAQNIDWLKQKLDAGADAAITQFFFDPEQFLRFRDACVTAGIAKPIIPGILPIKNWNAVQRFAQKCSVPIPQRLAQGFDRAERANRTDLFALSQVIGLCARLYDEGIEQFHIYTLNTAKLAKDLCAAMTGDPTYQMTQRPSQNQLMGAATA